MSGAIAAVVFDMDGLLLDSERLYLAAFRQAEAATGAGADDALYARLVGTDERTGMPVLQAALGEATAAFAAAWEARTKVALAGAIPVKPGVRDLLAALAAAGTPFAVAPSTRTAAARSRLGEAGLGGFAHVVGGDAVARGKPAPDIYLAAAERLGVAPGACAAFEDSEAGTRAALSAGMRVVQVPDLVKPSPAFAASGQIVAGDVLEGAGALGLIAVTA